MSLKEMGGCSSAGTACLAHHRNKMGGVAQLGERLPCTQEVIGSIPFTSTIFLVVVV